MGELTPDPYEGVHPSLSGKLVALGRQGRLLVKKTNDDLIALGKIIREGKNACDHGLFQKWVRTEFGITPKTAQKYMQVADRLSGKSELNSLLDQNSLYSLSAPSTPDAVVEEIEQRIIDGEKVTLAEIKKAIKAATEESPDIPSGDNGKPVLDGLKKPVPDALREAFAGVRTHRVLVRELGSILKKGIELAEQEGGELLSPPDLRGAIRTAQNQFRFATPFAPCPDCDGKGCRKKDSWCQGTGYVVKQSFDHMPPEVKDKLQSR
jgi:hypothetical protein